MLLGIPDRPVNQQMSHLTDLPGHLLVQWLSAHQGDYVQCCVIVSGQRATNQCRSTLLLWLSSRFQVANEIQWTLSVSRPAREVEGKRVARGHTCVWWCVSVSNQQTVTVVTLHAVIGLKMFSTCIQLYIKPRMTITTYIICFVVFSY